MSVAVVDKCSMPDMSSFRSELKQCDVLSV